MSDSSRPALIRGVGAVGVALLVLNSMIGAGIFALPGLVAAEAGALSPWLFLLIGGLFITIVLTFSELASYFDESGGPVLYTNAAFGSLAGFSSGWLLYLSRMTAFAANATAMALYLGAIWPWVATDSGRVIFISAVCVGLTLANYVGVREGIRTVAVFTLFKLTPILLMVLLGLKEVTGDILLPAELPDVEDFGGLTLLIIYAFIGFEAPLAISGETRDAKRTIPRSVVLTVLLTAGLYFLIMLVFVSVLDADEHAGSTLVDVGEKLLGSWGGLCLGLAAVFSIGGNLAANMLTVPRLSFALGERGMLPAWFCSVHKRYFTPGNSILLLGCLGLFFALTGSFTFLATASSLMRLITYMLCIAALPGVRRKASEEQRLRAFRLPGGWLIPVIAMLLCLWIGSSATAQAWLTTAALLGAGLVLYWLARRFAAPAGDQPD